jgi:hypothetical protein
MKHSLSYKNLTASRNQDSDLDLESGSKTKNRNTTKGKYKIETKVRYGGPIPTHVTVSGVEELETEGQASKGHTGARGMPVAASDRRFLLSPRLLVRG